MASQQNPRIIVGDTPAKVCNKLTDYLVEAMKAKAGPFHLALSGGSTPKTWFRQLANEDRHRIDWSSLHCYWGDDRLVPYESEQSNYGEARRLLFDQVPIPSAQIHPVPVHMNPELCASAYSELLLRELPRNSDGMPILDMNLLGMGGDGHTASIFPHDMELLKDPKVCAVAYHPESGQPRVTMTGPMINAGDRVAFLITGEKKRSRLAQVFGLKEGGDRLPATHVQPHTGELVFFVDEEADPRG